MPFARRVLLVLGSFATACSANEPHAPEAAVADPEPTFDVGAVIAQVDLAFRPEAGGFRGDHATYTVHADAERIAIAPRAEGKPGRTGELSTTAITRGDTAIDRPARSPRLLDDGRLALDRGAVIEHVENSAQGVEQSWDFATRPAGSGDLVVRVAVAGLPYAGATANGLHFLDETGLGLRYGHATWIDARGEERALPATWDGDAIAITVPAGIVDEAAYPAVLDPVISAEVGMDNPVTSAAAFAQRNPSVAFDGTNFLVVWDDTRIDNTQADIYGARVSAAGVLLDPAGLLLASGPNDQRNPDVVWNGANFVVAWETTVGVGDKDIYATRVSPAGVPLEGGGSGLNIVTQSGMQHAVAVAHTSGVTMIVWQDERGASPAIYGGAINPAGGLVSAAGGFLISDAAGTQGSPDIAATASAFLVVWEDMRNGNLDVYGARVATNMNVTDPAGLVMAGGAGSQGDPRIAFGGTNYLVVYEQGAAGARDIHATVVAGATGVASAPIAVNTAAGDQTQAALAFDGTNYLVAWVIGNDVVGARVSAAGSLLDATGIVLSDPAIPVEVAPALAFGGGNYYLAWHYSSVVADVRGRRISTVPATVDPVATLSTSMNHQQRSAVAYDGTNFLVVWEDRRIDPVAIWGTRVSKAGLVLDPAGILILPTAQQPEVTFGGTSFLVVGRYGPGNISGQRVSSAGTLTGGAISISTATDEQAEPAAAFDGTNFLVVWEDRRNGATYDIWGSRVSTAGAVLDDPAVGIQISSAGFDQRNPSVSAFSSAFLVAWEDLRTPVNGFDVYAARVSGAGSLLDASGFAIATGTADQRDPRIAVGGITALVVFEDHNSITPPDVKGQRVNGAGALTGGSIVITTVMDNHAPAAAYDGAHFIVASHTGTDVVMQRVGTDGSLTGGVTNVAAGAPLETRAATASDGAGKTLVTYQYFDQAPNVLTMRVKARTVTNSPIGIACTTGNECASGFCVDNVCCLTSCDNNDATNCQACSVAAGGTLNGVCTPRGAGQTCRAQNGVCDVAETCDGSTAACPPNGFASAATTCRPGAGPCDVAEMCTGSAASCPPDSFAGNSTTCRPSAGACDPLETCNGLMAACPADVLASPATVCRPVALNGLCDVPESCTGASAQCPSDGYAPMLTSCRPAAGSCDVGETCNGASAFCPPDGFVGGGTTCRPSAGACDPLEACTGAMAACPADLLAGAGTPCRPSAGTCDVAESCTGASATCPADAFAPNGTPCPDGIVCDGSEVCTGGTCGSQPLSCNDADICTADMCSEPTGCTNAPIPNCCTTVDKCLDSNACTAEACTANQCVITPIPGCCNSKVDCDDGDPCTDDTCTGPGGTCQHAPISGCCTSAAQCNDGSSCTMDSCTLATNTCSHTGVPGCCTTNPECADNNACTTDTCNVGNGTCSNAPVSGCCLGDGDCEDGNICTTDTCSGPGGTCSFPAIANCCTSAGDCNDNDSCTTDSCNPTTNQCEHAGSCPDAGVPDAGVPDAMPDAGTGPNPDAGTVPPDAGGEEPEPGCGCRTAGGDLAGGWLLVGACALVLRRRRSR